MEKWSFVKKKVSFPFCNLNNIKCNSLIKNGNWRSIYKDYCEPTFGCNYLYLNLLWSSWCMTYEYWISGNDVAICRVGVVCERMAVHCKTLNIPRFSDRTYRNHIRFRQYMVLERFNFRKTGQVDSTKTTNLVENLKEMN
jgi:hypothetical protein